MKFLIALTFWDNHLCYSKIDLFRRRFDKKYHNFPLNQMTLIPPFSGINQMKGSLDKFIEHLGEELEDHLHGVSSLDLSFHGIDFKRGKRPLLYLTPQVPSDLFHCQEAMEEIIESHGGILKKSQLSLRGSSGKRNTFFPIGRLLDGGEGGESKAFKNMIQMALLEFPDPFNLSCKSIALFEKRASQWSFCQNLFHFSQVKAQSKDQIEKKNKKEEVFYERI